MTLFCGFVCRTIFKGPSIYFVIFHNALIHFGTNSFFSCWFFFLRVRIEILHHSHRTAGSRCMRIFPFNLFRVFEWKKKLYFYFQVKAIFYAFFYDSHVLFSCWIPFWLKSGIVLLLLLVPLFWPSMNCSLVNNLLDKYFVYSDKEIWVLFRSPFKHCGISLTCSKHFSSDSQCTTKIFQ